MKTLLNYLKAIILFFIPKKFKNENRISYIQQFKFPTSKPFIVNINNTSDEIKKKVEILGSYEYINNSGFDSDGNLVIMHDVVISSGIPNVSYKDILWSVMNKPISVGLTYLYSVSLNKIEETKYFNHQVEENIFLSKKEINGNYSGLWFNPTRNPYQNQNNVLTIKNVYEIDGFTKLIIDNIAPKTSVILQFYPFLEEPKLSVFEKFVKWLNKR